MTGLVTETERVEQVESPAPPRRRTWPATLATIGLPVLALALFMLWCARGSVPLVHIGLAGLAIAITQLLPGVVLWRVIRPRNGWLIEDLALGFVMGSVLAILAQIPAGLLGQRWLSGVICLAVAVIVLVVPAGRRRVLRARTSPLPWWWGGAVALWSLVTVPMLRGYFAGNQVQWAGGAFHAPHTDTNLHLALAAQMLERGPSRFPWVESEKLGYHYLSHAWIAQVSATSGVGIDEVMLRIMPSLFVVVLPVVVGIAAVRLTRTPWAGPVAAFIFMVGGRANPTGIGLALSSQTPYSPSVAPSAGPLVVLVVLMALRWRGEVARWATLPVVFVLAVVAAGTKGATTPLVVAGAALALVAMLVFDRSRWKVVVPDLLAVGLGLEVAMKLIFRDSEAGLHLSLSDAANQTWLSDNVGTGTGTAFDLIAATSTIVTTLGAAALGLSFIFFKDLRRKPELWLLGGAVCAAAGAGGLFAHPGRSQGYFPIAGKPLMALISVMVLVELVRRLPAPAIGRLVAVAVVGGACFAWLAPLFVTDPTDKGLVYTVLGLGVVIIVLTGLVAALVVDKQRIALGFTGAFAAMLVAASLGGARALTAVPAAPTTPVKATTPLAESMPMIRAARYIRDHSQRDDMVMTNDHCVSSASDPSQGCDSRSFVAAAYSQRQVLVEGWTATPRSAQEGPNGRDSITVAYWHPALLKLNDQFIAAPTQSAAKDLWKRGVRWVYADHRRPWSKNLGTFGTLRFRDRDVNVYQLHAPS